MSLILIILGLGIWTLAICESGGLICSDYLRLISHSLSLYHLHREYTVRPLDFTYPLGCTLVRRIRV